MPPAPSTTPPLTPTARTPVEPCFRAALFAISVGLAGFILGCGDSGNTATGPAFVGPAAPGAPGPGVPPGGGAGMVVAPGPAKPVPGGVMGGAGTVVPPSGGSAATGGSSATGGVSAIGGQAAVGGNVAAGGNANAGGSPPLVVPKFGKKNVLFIMADDLNDWAQPFGGHPQAKTPNIAKLAAKGTVFMSAHAPVPVCLPSRTNMLMGLRPHTSNIWGNADGYFRKFPALADRVTLPQFFQQNGYTTARAGKLFHGVDDTEDHPSWNMEFGGALGTRIPANYTPTHGMKLSGYNAEVPWGMHWGPTDEGREVQGDWLGAGYIADLLKQESAKPFFYAYGTSKPHQPWFVPQEYFDRFPLDDIVLTDVDPNDLADIPQQGRNLGNTDHTEFVRTNNWKQGIQAYLANLAFADDCVGRVLDALQAGPHKDDTIVLFMGDHGWHLGEKLHWGKATIWEESTRTPLIIYDPSVGRPGATNEPVSLQDLYLTLVELNALEAPKFKVEGRSLLPLMVDPANKAHVGWALSSWPNGHETLRTEKWALIRHGNGGNYVYELYDMLADPLQRTNLASRPERAELVGLLSADIDNIIANNEPKNQRVYEL